METKEGEEVRVHCICRRLLTFCIERSKLGRAEAQARNARLTLIGNGERDMIQLRAVRDRPTRQRHRNYSAPEIFNQSGCHYC